VVIFKQADGDQQHFITVAVTGSGIMIRERVARLMGENKAVGITTSFMFRRKDGKLAKVAYF
jgi:hypothetical protein